MAAAPTADPPSSRLDPSSRPRRICELVRCEVDGRRLVVEGEIDQLSVADVRLGLVDSLLDSAIRTIDLSGVTFFGAAGITLLEEFSLHHRYEVVGTPQIARVLDIVGCGHLVTRTEPRSAPPATPRQRSSERTSARSPRRRTAATSSGSSPRRSGRQPG